MEREQESEWAEAQRIVISEDLVAAAEQQLQFLASVDRRRSLYDGPLLERAIHRYKACWLPLLARHTESGDPDGSLVVPLDCEWIWHCHRLNPVRYKNDCEELYGRILDNKKVQSSLQVKSKGQSAELWAEFYPDEPFELDYENPTSETNYKMYAETFKAITYDLVSAVKRQSTFYYQVCRPVMNDKRFLDGAVSRYKGFLHLIKRDRKRSMRCFCVPTYDIDLMWHSHQLQPISYQKDMLELLGKVLEHDDTDSDRTKGKKLDTGFSKTTKHWEDTYGLRYWRAGAMYRGAAPSLVDAIPLSSSYNCTKALVSHKPEISLALQRPMVVEVLLEIVGISNLPANLKGNVFVSFSKKRPDMFLSDSCRLDIFTEMGEKMVASFECEPVGDLVLTVLTKSKPAKTIGTASISLELLDPNAKLCVDKWFELKPRCRRANPEPISLHVAVSFTAPFPAPHVFEMLKLHPFSMDSCLFPVPSSTQHIRSWTRFIDGFGNDIVSLKMRKSRETGGRKHPPWKKNIIGITRLSGKPHLFAEYDENTWFFKDLALSLIVEKKAGTDGHILVLKGCNLLKLFPGRKLEYQPRNLMQAKIEDFMTVVEFSSEYPYGKAVALLDMKFGLVKVSEDWFVLPALVLAFILSDLLKKRREITVIPSEENLKLMTSLNVKAREDYSEGTVTDNLSTKGVVATEAACTGALENDCHNDMGCGEKESSMNACSCGGCGAICGGGGCGNIAKSSGCGGGCGGECGSVLKSGGCESMLKNSGCGSGCGGSGCGDVFTGAKSSGCGGGGCGSCGAEMSVNGAKQDY